MARPVDPYRTLGLSRGATLDEVRRAYRRLAKEHHPDSAGESALSRFLAIQAAYEQIVGSGGDRPGGAGPAAGTGAPAEARRPWQADPTRSDATRRAYGARRRTSSSTSGPGRAGASGSGEDPGGRHGTDGDRPPNKATPGSTTYDGADEIFEPDWAGASWYGTSSGTFWTLNPKEYADPRKHGPEYQARARRAPRGRNGNGNAGAHGPDASETPDAPEAAGPSATTAESSGTGQPHSREAPTHDPHAAPSWWSASTEGAPAAEPGRPHEGDEPRYRSSTPAAPIPDPAETIRAVRAPILEPVPLGPGRRVLLALTGGIPLIIALAWVVGELTGCARFAATCQDGMEPLLVALAVAILGTAVAIPWLAAVASGGTLAALAAAIPATILFSATGGSRLPEESGSALGVVLVLAWLAGAAYVTARRRRGSPRESGPVS